MAETTVALPEDPSRPGRDVLGSKIGNRGHFIGNVMWTEARPMDPGEIGELAKPLAKSNGGRINPNTYSTEVTRNHLRWMREKQFAEQTSDGRWQLTELARQRIASCNAYATSGRAYPVGRDEVITREVRTVDSKSRVFLPWGFASATVTIEMVSETELRIQKAVVLPAADIPLMEDALIPLSNRDRDLFLELIDNPSEPTPAFRAAATKYKKRHG